VSERARRTREGGRWGLRVGGREQSGATAGNERDNREIVSHGGRAELAKQSRAPAHQRIHSEASAPRHRAPRCDLVPAVCRSVSLSLPIAFWFVHCPCPCVQARKPNGQDRTGQDRTGQDRTERPPSQPHRRQHPRTSQPAHAIGCHHLPPPCMAPSFCRCCLPLCCLPSFVSTKAPSRHSRDKPAKEQRAREGKGGERGEEGEHRTGLLRHSALTVPFARCPLLFLSLLSCLCRAWIRPLPPPLSPDLTSISFLHSHSHSHRIGHSLSAFSFPPSAVSSFAPRRLVVPSSSGLVRLLLFADPLSFALSPFRP
jgi:hypothetical protein